MLRFWGQQAAGLSFPSLPRPSQFCTFTLGCAVETRTTEKAVFVPPYTTSAARYVLGGNPAGHKAVTGSSEMCSAFGKVLGWI